LEDSKILTLWFNSSLFLLEILTRRTQTRGTWGRIDKNLIFKTSSIDPTKLSKEERGELLRLFGDLNSDFPSLMDQLKSGFPRRTQVDREFFKILGVPEEEQGALIEELHGALLARLLSMKVTMQAD
jgi:hypothetical protein